MPKQQSKTQNQLQALRVKQGKKGQSNGGQSFASAVKSSKGGNNAADLSMKNRRLAKELNEFKGKHTQLSREKSLLHTRNMKLESTVRSLSCQTSTLQNEIFAMEEDRRAYETTIQSLRDELRAIKIATPTLNNVSNDVTNDNSLTFSSFGHLALVDTATSPWAGTGIIGSENDMTTIKAEKSYNSEDDGNYPLSPISIMPFTGGKLSPTAELRSFHRKMGESRRGVTTERGGRGHISLPPGFDSPVTSPPPHLHLTGWESEAKENKDPVVLEARGEFNAAFLSPPKRDVGVIGSSRPILTPNHSPPPSLSPDLKIVKRPRRKSAARVISYEEPSTTGKIRRGHVFFPKED